MSEGGYPTQIRRSRLPAFLLGTTLLLILLGQRHPFDFGFVGAGLDPSWVAASIYARTHGLVFGHDFVFTSGPWASFYMRGYASELVVPTIAFMILSLIFLVASTLALLRSKGKADRQHGLLWLIILLLGETFSSADITFFALPLLTATLVAVDRRLTALATFGMALTAFAAEAKFSVVPLAFGSFLLADITLVATKRWPLTVIGFVIFCAAAFLLAGQPLAALPGFFIAGVQTSSGYSAAMSLDGKWVELGIWVALAVVVVLYLVRLVFEGESRGRAAVQALLLCGVLFVAMKEGFVRHDGHSHTAWMALLLVSLVGEVSLRPAARAWAPLSIVILVAAWFCNAYGIGGLPSPNLPHALQQIVAQLQKGAAIIWRPQAVLEGLAAQDSAAKAATRQQRPVPTLAGSVDIIPSDQSSLIAANLDYRPRPTIQEYSAYTPALIDRDRAFFLSERAPQYLLMTPGSIDGHHPASAEGALWPLFLERYQPQSIASGNLILVKRTTPLSGVLGPATTVLTGLDQDVSLPATTGAWFVRINIAETVWGKVFDYAFKPPEVFLSLRYADGSEHRYRLIPGMASEGMLLSPTIATVGDLNSLFHGDGQNLLHPVSLRISTDPLGSVAYEAPVPITFQPVNLSMLGGLATTWPAGN